MLSQEHYINSCQKVGACQSVSASGLIRLQLFPVTQQQECLWLSYEYRREKKGVHDHVEPCIHSVAWAGMKLERTITHTWIKPVTQYSMTKTYEVQCNGTHRVAADNVNNAVNRGWKQIMPISFVSVVPLLQHYNTSLNRCIYFFF